MNTDLLTSQPVSLNLAALNEDVQRIKYKRDPVKWAADRLGVFLWSKQREILRSVVDNRQTAVVTCHTVGKSYVAALACCWWGDVHAPSDAFIVTTAPSAPQVKAILWREMNRIHKKANLDGEMLQTEWWITGREGNREMIAFGRKPDDYDISAFQGIHQNFVLIGFDEAGGIEGLWEPASSLVSNEGGRFIVFGNPDNPSSHFAKICSPGSGWNVIWISAFDTPNFTREVVPKSLSRSLISVQWQQEKLRTWGEDNPFYQSKVLGLFPKSGTDGLIPLAWIMRAQKLDLLDTLNEDSIVELGVDVGAGGDKNVVCKRKGYRCRIIREDFEPNTMTSLGNLIADAREHEANLTKVDYNGIGRGMVDECKLRFAGGRMNWDHCWDVEKTKNYLPIIGVMMGSAANYREGYINLRAEIFWGLRQLFEKDLIDLDPADDDLAAQLVSLKYRRTPAGKMQISPKSHVTKSKSSNELEVLKASPDLADALAMCCMPKPVSRYRSMSRKRKQR